jgi:hypothetical protein
MPIGANQDIEADVLAEWLLLPHKSGAVIALCYGSTN